MLAKKIKLHSYRNFYLTSKKIIFVNLLVSFVTKLNLVQTVCFNVHILAASGFTAGILYDSVLLDALVCSLNNETPIIVIATCTLL